MRLAVLRGSAQPVMHRAVGEAQAYLARADTPAPRCVFVDGAIPGVEAFVAWMRGEGRLFSGPVVVMVPDVDDDAFSEAHSFGADDVIAGGDDRQITRRLLNLEGFDPAARPPIVQGRAVVAHPDETKRRVLGRILRHGGFDVSFASHEAEVLEVAEQGERPQLIVASDEIEGGALGTIMAVRTATSAPGLPGVVLGATKDLPSLGKTAFEHGSIAVSSAHAPPDNLLFLANELLRPDVKNIRASARLLFCTVCAFRVAGRMHPAYGLTYNVSREGLYVRTLTAPPSGSRVWFEIRPWDCAEAAHLRGVVVWTRGLNSAAGGAVPPGFAIRLDAQACPPADLQAFRDAYDTQQGIEQFAA